MLASQTVWANAPIHSPPLDLSSQEYHRLWDQYINEVGLMGLESLDYEVEQAVRGGQRLHEWVELMNDGRPPGDHIFLTSEEDRTSTPITDPKAYGPKTIQEQYNQYVEDFPHEIIDVVYGDKAYPQVISMPQGVFVYYARQIDRLYQTAVRWTTVISPSRGAYIARQTSDVRGYYYLRQDANLDKKLSTFAVLPPETQVQFREWLIGICRNSHAARNRCVAALETAITQEKVREFKDVYWEHAERKWNSFFTINRPRGDIEWSYDNPSIATIPFSDPGNDRVLNFLKDNVEDEFMNSVWGLKINFKSTRFWEYGTPSIRFQKGVTPHVTGGWNNIVMDGAASLDEYEVQWTIRHEFGHILRLPDCYVEFYDPDQELAINYQLDITDLMCSRAGNFNDRIYSELKRVYLR